MTIAANTLFHADWIIVVIVDVVRYVQVQMSIIVKVEECSTGAPRRRVAGDAGLLSHVGKGAVPIVMIKNIRTKIRNVDVRKAVVIIVTYSHSRPITSIASYASLGSHVFELAIAHVSV